jgi:histone-lysine N-methyltransferase SETMAR
MLKEKSLVIYWHSKDYDANAIHRKLVTHFGDDTPGYSTVTKWLRRLVCGDDILEPVERKGKESGGLVDLKILIAFTAFPFHSVRTFASSPKIPRSTVYDHLQRGNFTVKHLRWVSHTLDDCAKRVRVDMANSMLKMIAEARHQSWRSFLTGDESWFFYSTDYEQMWLPRGEMAPTRARHIISRPKVLITIFWSPLSFPVIDVLPTREKFTALYFCDNIAPQIAEQRSSDARQKTGRKLVVHMDNAAPHRAKLTKSRFKTLRLREADHPPYSPDLAPSSFYLFGKLKGQMAGGQFESTEVLLATIRRPEMRSRERNLNQFFKNGKEDWRNASRLRETTFREKNLVN